MKFLQFFRHKKDSGGMSSYRVKEFIAVIRILEFATLCYQSVGVIKWPNLALVVCSLCSELCSSVRGKSSRTVSIRNSLHLLELPLENTNNTNFTILMQGKNRILQNNLLYF